MQKKYNMQGERILSAIVKTQIFETVQRFTSEECYASTITDFPVTLKTLEITVNLHY